MNPIKTTNNPALIALTRAAYPESKYRKIYAKEFRGPMSLNSYWNEGYRDYFQIVRLADNCPVASVPQNGTPFDGKNLSLSELPEGFALVVRHFAGCAEYGSIYFHPDNLTKFLPAPADANAPEITLGPTAAAAWLTQNFSGRRLDYALRSLNYAADCAQFANPDASPVWTPDQLAKFAS